MLIRCATAFFVLFVSFHATAQKKSRCFRTLSHKYDYELQVDTQTHTTTVVIKGKSSHRLIQSLSFTYDMWPFKVYDFSARSYVTGYHRTRGVCDDDFGSIVVADINFDGREDFAVQVAYTNAYGSLYRYFIQDAHGQFHAFTGFGEFWKGEQHLLFPYKIDVNNKTLVFWNRRGARKGVNTFVKYNPQTKTWKTTKVVIDHYEEGKIVKSVCE